MAEKAATVAAYLAGLPMERRAAIEAVRGLVRHRLPRGYRETLAWGGITYEMPLKRYPYTCGHRGQEPGLSRASRWLTAAG